VTSGKACKIGLLRKEGEVKDKIILTLMKIISENKIKVPDIILEALFQLYGKDYEKAKRKEDADKEVNTDPDLTTKNVC
jgi:hypothetical protein